MPYLSQINHPKELTKSKVNFFADYFQFATRQMGQYDGLEIENYLSLIEKIIYQIENNIERCPPYLNSYVAHPLFQRYFRQFKSYRSVKYYFDKYSSLSKDGQKKEWLQKKKTVFLKALHKCQKDLKRKQFKKALQAIISYLKCKHKIEKHKKEIFYFTNIIVSEFLLNDRSKSDTVKIFEKIITQEAKDFPFPKSFLDNIKGDKEEAKNDFIKNRTFNQQFEGIYNLFKQQGDGHFFLYRIYNINAPKTFSFKYNRVTFYHPKHEKLKEIFKEVRKTGLFLKKFFNTKNMLVAVVKIKYYSSEIAETNAIKTISNELDYLNKMCGSSGYLERHSYLVTSDFKTSGGQWRHKERPHTITESQSLKLRDNPYCFLKKTSAAKHLLNYEPMFITAISSQDVSDYWSYLEALIGLPSGKSKKVIETVSTILLLNAEEVNKRSLQGYIEDCAYHFQYPESLTGLTKERQEFFYSQLSTKGELDFDQLMKELKHPFLNYLSRTFYKPYSKNDFKLLQHHYERILIEAYAQRNAIIHTGKPHEKSLISIHSSFPYFIMRLRWIIFRALENKTVGSFRELIEELKSDGQKLL